MNLKEKCILPLINRNISKNDIASNTGFAGLALEDLNNEAITNCIFLIYKVVDTKEYKDTVTKLKSLNNLYTVLYHTIDKVNYRVFVFTINDFYKKEIEYIKDGYLNNITLLAKYVITYFYGNDSEYDLFYSLFNNDILPYKIEPIPIEDYKYSFIEQIIKNGPNEVNR